MKLLQKIVKRPAESDALMPWRCQSCSKWNAPDLEECGKCAQVRPIPVDEANGRKQIIHMLKIANSYAVDKKMMLTGICIRAVIIALQTETEGFLVHHMRGFASLHALYSKIPDLVLTTIDKSDK